MTKTLTTAVAGMGLLAVLLVAGCGGGQAKKEGPFFTSGDREADQRAEQRMAKTEQMRGEGEGQAGEKKPSDPSKRPLYERLGGEKGIANIVDDFVTRALADPRVNWERKGVKRGGFSIHSNQSVQWNAGGDAVVKLKKHLAQFFALATGGPSTYEGRDMGEAHATLHITNAEFDASIGDLKASLDKFGIPNQEQKELLSIVESARSQVVAER